MPRVQLFGLVEGLAVEGRGGGGGEGAAADGDARGELVVGEHVGRREGGSPRSPAGLRPRGREMKCDLNMFGFDKLLSTWTLLALFALTTVLADL